MLQIKKVINLKNILSLFILTLMAIFTLFSKKYIAVTLNGLKLFASVILPSLFPFMFLTALLTKLGGIQKLTQKLNFVSQKLFGVSNVGIYLFMISAFSGYPIGSKLTLDLYKNNLINNNEKNVLSILASTSGPIFVIGSIGAITFNSVKKGIIIYISHIVATIIVSIIFKNKTPTTKKPLNLKLDQNILYNSMYESVIGILTAGGFITIFYVFAEILKDIKILTPIANLLAFLFKDQKIADGVTYGLIEFTGGLKVLALSKSVFALPLASFLISFGGLSIIVQSYIYLSQIKIPAISFIFKKILQAFVSFIICLVLTMLFA